MRSPSLDVIVLILTRLAFVAIVGIVIAVALVQAPALVDVMR